ncbi:DUF5602 domain-containing protein [Zeaxanthinibacter enoshimensis]|uniref:TTHB210-like domain-containing protein n=1 Tax=Zeaxanthinibacter enoshimensis TaxID=392009 RepID=A0A4R6TNI3_9FLAO|nr:DUF5602 domain-containing protein [Zeaxanthinibacter enoshimensis]TDQ32670.1 hypothetical protein CLV82_0503 [Zeaxanthinibacter enoshimensis]
MRTTHYIGLAFCLLALQGCEYYGHGSGEDAGDHHKTSYTGEQIAIGDGHAWTIVKTDIWGNPKAIGIQFTEEALENLPTGHAHGHETVLELPVDKPVAPYDHVTLDWNEMGHEPPGVYDLPHFDIHFYMIGMTERDAIGPTDDEQFNKPMPDGFLPPMYLETPGGVPSMGAHMIDLLSPEIAGTGIFTYTFIYGKYDGMMNFLEPMVTRDFLLSKTRVASEIRRPDAYQTPGHYPDELTICFDEDSGVYTILMEGLEEF